MSCLIAFHCSAYFSIFTIFDIAFANKVDGAAPGSTSISLLGIIESSIRF
jgi:hypothetical protein